MTFDQIALFLALGICTGFVAGLLGIGGGMIMVPFLTMIFTSYHFPPEHLIHMAIATSMTTIIFTSMSSIRAQLKRKIIRWDVVRGLAPGIILGGILGGGEVFNLLKTSWLSLFFACFVSFSAYQILANKKPKPNREIPKVPGLLGVGGLIGTLSSLVGAGGGFMSVPFMLWCNISIHNAIATSTALGLPLAISSAIGYILGSFQVVGLPEYSWGFIYLPALLGISITSVIMAPVGVKVGHSLSSVQLRKAFAIILFFLAFYMLTKSIQAFGAHPFA